MEGGKVNTEEIGRWLRLEGRREWKEAENERRKILDGVRD